MRLLTALLLAAIGACAGPPALPERPAAALEPVWQAWWTQDLSAAEAAAEPLGWRAAGSVDGERLRQALASQRGQRPRLIAELRAWRAAAPEDPDLAYLEARLLQDPERAERRFRELAQRHPRHPWIRLGLASIVQSRGGSSAVVRRLLERAPRRQDAAAFRRQVEARVLASEGEAEAAFGLLEADAFVRGDRDALYTWVELAEEHGQPEQERRGRTEIELRRITADQPAEQRLAAVAERALAEARSAPDLDLEQFLLRLDDWSLRAGLPTGWTEHPRYSLGPIGELLRPERDSGSVAAWWAERGTVLLVGEAVFHGLEVLLLSGAESHALPWPGESAPLEIVVAERGRSSRSNLAAGGTIFRGFYIRRDLLRLGALGLDERAALVEAPPAPVEIPPSLEPDPTEDRLPEDWDLALRLQARVLREVPGGALDRELELLLLHEAGHLDDVLRWLPDGPSFLAALPSVLHSLLASGDPMTWLEYRAAARAIAASPHPRWALADLLRTVRGGTPRYRTAYGWLLADLLELGRARELPPLHRWDELDPAVLHELAATVLEQEALSPLPPAAVRQLLDAAGPAARRSLGGEDAPLRRAETAPAGG